MYNSEAIRARAKLVKFQRLDASVSALMPRSRPRSKSSRATEVASMSKARPRSSTCSRSACPSRRSFRSCIASAARCCFSVRWLCLLWHARAQPRLPRSASQHASAIIEQPLVKLVAARASSGRICHHFCAGIRHLAARPATSASSCAGARVDALAVLVVELRADARARSAAMVKPRVVVGAHYGLRDWLAQRVTAVVMAVYTLFFARRCCSRARRARLRRAGATLFAHRLDARRDAALRREPRLARVGRRARHLHGLRQADRACASRSTCCVLLLLVAYVVWAVQILWGVDEWRSPVRQFDAVVVGAGGSGHARGAGARAQPDLKVAVLSKVFPTRSHTVAAQGGVAASLGNTSEDNWHWHMYDTVKGSDYLGDQDAIEFMCRKATEVVIELEHFGMPFDRLDERQDLPAPVRRPHAATTASEPVKRACAAADRTGHAMLHTLYQRNVRAQHAVLRRMDGARPDPRPAGRRGARRDRAGDGDRRGDDPPGARRRCSPPAARGASTPPAPTPSSTPATASAWRRAPASRSRTWSSGSSTRPAWPAPAC